MERTNLVIGLLVGILTLLTALVGFSWNASRNWTTMQMTQAEIRRDVDNNTKAIAVHESSIREEQRNQDKILIIIQMEHKQGK